MSVCNTDSFVPEAKLLPFLDLPAQVPASYRLAKEESFGFFDYVSDSEWKELKDVARSFVHQHPNVSTETVPAIWYFQNYYPFFTCPHDLRRVGGLGDGPKYMCDPHRLPDMAKARQDGEACLIYSVGSRAKFEFEDGIQEIIGNACEIHVFDPKWKGSPDLAERNIQYHQWGLKSSNDVNSSSLKGNYYSLQEIMASLNHTSRVVDVFKIDCEGCEWSTYRDWLNVDIRQLLVETHSLCEDGIEASIAFFEDIRNAGYVTVSREANIHPQATQQGNMGFEWTFLRLSKRFMGI